MADDTPNPGAAGILTQRLASSATGWGVVIDGVLNIRTVTDSRNGAAMNALYVGGARVLSICRDPDCDCMVKALAQHMPGARLVAVSVRVELPL